LVSPAAPRRATSLAVAACESPTSAIGPQDSIEWHWFLLLVELPYILRHE
jgi:hypothetical protein